jgi:hypothetical protein
MDNSVLPYQVQTDSEEESNSSDSSEEGNLLTNNIGVLYNGGNVKDERFMNQEKVEDFQNHRNKIFTPEITKKFITVFKDDGNSTKIISLEDDFNIQTDNIIGFKIVRSSFNSDSTSLSHFDLSIPEIPAIACDINDSGQNIISRIPLAQDTNIFLNYPFLEYATINRYFYPIKLDKLTLTLTQDLKGYFVFEISYLNQ